MSRLRLTARLRIALAFGVLFFVGGLILLTLVYTLVRNDLLTPGPDRSVTPGEADTPEQEQLERDVRASVRNEALDSLLLRSGVVLVGLSVGSVLGGWVVAGIVLRPVHRITDIAKRASTTNLDQRVHLEGPDDELKDLADTFDTMLDRLQSGIDARRSFAANAAHELRTPLTVIRTATDVGLTGTPSPSPEAVAEAAGDIRSATVQAEQLIDRLLEFARSEHGLQELESVDLRVVVQDALAQVDAAAEHHHLQVSTDLEDETVRGDPTLIELAVTNLIGNAVRHSTEGGVLQVVVRPDVGSAVIEVTNDGTVIDADRVPHLVQPFVRGDGSRLQTTNVGGTGLGLSIVQAVADAHGGDLQLEARDEGGLHVMLTLPTNGPAT